MCSLYWSSDSNVLQGPSQVTKIVSEVLLTYSAQPRSHEFVVRLIKATAGLLHAFAVEDLMVLLPGVVRVLRNGATEPTGSLWDEVTETTLELMRNMFESKSQGTRPPFWLLEFTCVDGAVLALTTYVETLGRWVSRGYSPRAGDLFQVVAQEIIEKSRDCIRDGSVDAFKRAYELLPLIILGEPLAAEVSSIVSVQGPRLNNATFLRGIDHI